MMRTKNPFVHGAIVALMIASTSGCSSMNKTEKGAVIGAAGGAAVGGVIGHATGSTAKGAILGAVVGGAAGAIIGHQMDKQAEEIKQNVPGATVERVGEGIAVTFASGLLFDFDSDVLRSEAKHNLDALAGSLKEYDNSDLLIVGHTDNVGSDTYNLGLSERRARSAAQYLASRGVTRYDTRGRGETEPIASNDTEAGRQQNRRVEIAIYASEEARQRAKQQAAGG
ncbi:MAG TPA: OmpA family protein [Candidatus Eisenbacteria bacterium]|jgi:outer membrane protein OmpA-like peptidoglycan-associated protein|nr:OmpA family protein [Candidatus Eisenbacteria bacterium]